MARRTRRETDSTTDENRQALLVRLYGNMVKSLETISEGRGLGDLFAQLRASGESRSLPLERDEEVRHMLTRLGLLDPRLDAATAGKHVGELVRDTAEAASRTPAQVSIVLRLYASGMYGVMPQPVCGAPPRCHVCGLTKDCDHFNRPRKTPDSRELSPIKRLARNGGEALSEQEVLAMILAGPRPGKMHFDLAGALLDRFGSLRALAAASYDEVAALRNVTETIAARICAATALHRRVLSEKRLLGATVRSGKDFYDLYHAMLRDLKKEVFLVVLLDQKNRILREEKVSEGTLTNSLVHPREVFGPAIRHAAASVAFVHNHPSGDSRPSGDDKRLTQRLSKAAEHIGIRILDHVIVGESSYTSFIDEGLL